MMRLKSKLLSLNSDKAQKVKVFSPRNCEELRIPFKADKTAKVVGKLASIPPPQHLPDGSGEEDAQLITGVLVQNDFKMLLMAPEDLREYAGLTTTIITCKQRLTLSAAGIDLIKWALEGTFGSIEEVPAGKAISETNGDGHTNGYGVSEEADEEVSRQSTEYLVMGCVTVRYENSGEVQLEWEGNMLNDGIADAVMAVLFSVESSPAAVKREYNMVRYICVDTANGNIESSSKHTHSHDRTSDLPPRNPHAHLSPTERLERLFMFLEAQFGGDALSPIAIPKMPTTMPGQLLTAPASPASVKSSPESGNDTGEEDDDMEARVEAEIGRLHKMGIPVPGVEVKVDKMVARVWLENLEVECPNRVFGDRVRAVVERAVEVTAPLWG